jgi:hypothetical protein
MTTPKITLHRDDAQELLDALAGSLDFGSGSLSTEAVVALRNLATVLGVGQIDVTPTEYVNTHVHIPVPETYTPRKWIEKGEALPAGWRYVDTNRFYLDADRFQGVATTDPRERCKTCARAGNGRGSGELDAPIHRPWVADISGHELAYVCRCGHGTLQHVRSGRCAGYVNTNGCRCRAYVDASVTL